MSVSQSRHAGGLKAALKNPNVSDEAKESAQERLDNLPEDTSETGDRGISTGKNTGNVLGGYKATLKNPRVSDEAKENAERVLKENEVI